MFVGMSDSGGYGGNTGGDTYNGDILKEKNIRRYIEDLLPKRFVTTHKENYNLRFLKLSDMTRQHPSLPVLWLD